MWGSCFSPSPFVFNPISIQLIHIHLTEPKRYFPIFWISKQKLLTVFNNPFVAVNCFPYRIFFSSFTHTLGFAIARWLIGMRAGRLEGIGVWQKKG